MHRHHRTSLRLKEIARSEVPYLSRLPPMAADTFGKVSPKSCASTRDGRCRQEPEWIPRPTAYEAVLDPFPQYHSNPPIPLHGSYLSVRSARYGPALATSPEIE